MKGIPVVIIGKIVEGALEGDLVKVNAYTKLAIENLESDGDKLGAKILSSKLDGTYKDKSNVTLD